MHDQSIPIGYCQCGCGERTKIATRTRPSRGSVKGEPQRYIANHNRRASGPQYEVREAGYETPCWIWRWRRNNRGYGVLWKAGRRGYAHRYFYEEAKGPIPEGLQIDHLCCNPACVNPDHLEAVTNTENVRRGRATKLTADQVRAIRADTGLCREIGARYGIHHAVVSRIRTGKSWRDV